MLEEVWRRTMSAQLAPENNASTCWRILLVENELLSAAMLRTMFLDSGTRILQAQNTGQALGVIEQASIHAAVLDVRFWPIIWRLKQVGVPFFLTCSQDEREVDPEIRDYPVVRKPYGIAEVQSILEHLLEGAPLPAGHRFVSSLKRHLARPCDARGAPAAWWRTPCSGKPSFQQELDE